MLWPLWQHALNGKNEAVMAIERHQSKSGAVVDPWSGQQQHIALGVWSAAVEKWPIK
jgi:hypothetical protein